MELNYQTFALVAVQILGVQSLIVPDEIPSLLSIVYSNVPTIKKGTDSRLGYGFRLGNRADFQVMVELGPQTNTQPLANQPDKETGQNRKRSPADNLANALYAAQQAPKHTSNTEGGKWLEKWSDSFRYVDGSGKLPPVPRPGLGVGEIDAKSIIPPDYQHEADRIHQSDVLREIEESREGRSSESIEDDALLRLLKLMERLHQQLEIERQGRKDIDEKNTTNNISAISPAKLEEVPKRRNTTKDREKNNPTLSSAQKIASVYGNTSPAVPAIKNNSTSSNLLQQKTSHPDMIVKMTLPIRPFISFSSENPTKNFQIITETNSKKVEVKNLKTDIKVIEPKPEGLSLKDAQPFNEKALQKLETTKTATETDSQSQKEFTKKIQSTTTEIPRKTQSQVKTKTSRSNLNQPLPDETFIQFFLRRLGYYDYLRTFRRNDAPQNKTLTTKSIGTVTESSNELHSNRTI